ncbi:glycerol-3-phosphate acyltransferase [Paludifilum halophilum]|uniref:Uncharacterized protein n=1 Tax=Paludifilum halophilum TaxID=1642702 RepID=A0A235B5B8_9BACL|nr:glycerol-3-phosphate acyltransferase [Paludifilum halophilum]OYD07506.1 hypothetical protein CHM34_11465 [Paludifilum halophilum]
MNLLTVILVAYLIGSLPITAFYSKKGFRRDLSSRSAAGFRREPLLSVGMEMGKGALAALLGLVLHGWTGAAFASIAVVLGQIYPVFTGFRGGRGAAVSAGALLIMSPLLVLIGIGIYWALLFVTRYRSISMVSAVICVMVLTLVLFPELYVILVVFGLGSLVLLRYAGSVRRWRKGTEPPFRWRGLGRWR